MPNRPPRSRTALVALAFAFVLAPGCGGAPDEADLQKWTGSEVGFQKIAKVVRDKDMPAETRVRALEVVVEKQQELRVRGMVELITDQNDRQAIVRQLVMRLAQQVETRGPSQLTAKDAILMLLRYLTPEQLDQVQQVIAKWAFADISWDTPAADLKSKLESRISAGQISDLGPYGLESAAILLANGFIAEQMVRYLGSSSSPQAKPLLIKAFRRFIPAFLNVNPFYLDAIRKTQDPAGAELLFQLYREPKLDQKARDACFSVGAMMLEAPTIKGQAASRPIIDQLLAIGRTDSIEDRWLAAANILVITGGSGLGEVLDLFKDDKRYGDAAANGNSVLDLCFELADPKSGPADAAQPAIAQALAQGNRVQKAMAILCAKTLALAPLKPALANIAANLGKKGDVAIADFLGDASLEDDKKAPLTLGFLAQNAIEGIDLLAASNLPSLDEAKRTARHFVISVEFAALGERYAKLVEERYQESISKPPPK